MPKIEFIDVTNRDGEQTARISLSKLQKTVVNWLLDQMGVYQSEMGFPLTAHEANYINANVALTKQECGENGPLIKQIQLSGWSRALASDVKIAQERTNVEHFNLSIVRQAIAGNLYACSTDSPRQAVNINSGNFFFIQNHIMVISLCP